MKTPTLLFLALLILSGLSLGSSWDSLTKIDDKITLKKGEVAMIVAVSQPIYLNIQRPQKSEVGIRLAPNDHRRLFDRPGTSRYSQRQVRQVGWKQPFPIAGPCTLRLGTAAVVTMQIHSAPEKR